MRSNQQEFSAIYEYWNSHVLGLQYIRDKDIVIGSPEFFEHIRPWMNPYKFPWIMERIEREAAILKGKRLLEVGCGLGFDSLEFIKRGVRVTATDLTPSAVDLAYKHFEIKNARADDLKIEDVLDLTFDDNAFDAVWANGVIHATADPNKAIQNIRRVLKPGGRAIISHFYRKPSWMYLLHLLGRENIEFKEEDPPINKFLTEGEIEAKFDGFRIQERAQEHYRAMPICRGGVKAALYKFAFKPIYNLIPEPIAKRFAYKYSIVAIKR